MSLLIVILEFLSDGPSKNRTGDADRRRCGTTGKQGDGDERCEFLHNVSRIDRIQTLAGPTNPQSG
jgi:hypothetical protein